MITTSKLITKANNYNKCFMLKYVNYCYFQVLCKMDGFQFTAQTILRREFLNLFLKFLGLRNKELRLIFNLHHFFVTVLGYLTILVSHINQLSSVMWGSDVCEKQKVFNFTFIIVFTNLIEVKIRIGHCNATSIGFWNIS